MQSINALSLTPDVKGWLSGSYHPRMLHVFERACNLINERREVLSIVTQAIGDGPFNLVIEEDVLFSDHLNLESPISNYPNLLKIGDLTINAQNARSWSARPDWEILHARRFDIFDQITKLPITNYQVSDLDTLFATNAQGYSTTIFQPKLPITNYQSQVSNSLISSFATADLPASLDSTQKLAGLGIGLTPSGDDFIMGAIHAAWIIHSINVVAVLAAEVAAVASALTTSLSWGWLRAAGRGEAGILWHQFFDALLSAEQAAIQESIDKIFSIGETSGADALSGFISSFAAWSVETHS